MTCAPHTQPLQEDEESRTALERHNARDTVVAEEEGKAVREGRQAGWGGWARLAWVASRVGWHLRGKIAFLKAGFRSSFNNHDYCEWHPRSHHKGTTSRVRTGVPWYPVLCQSHCQQRQDIIM